jgi:coenzyme F420-reducing hydrogenase gamma subunit
VACRVQPIKEISFDKKEIQFILDRFDNRELVSPLSDIVKVDDYISGCPMDEKLFLTKLNQYVKEFEIVNA